ncbi:MAG TPA: hypothetical protein VNX67_08785 [Solirubrobacteraceae bacterium]|jgi:hypothetical protein|nr:hypothetical protein [Solirubrobacteraceae bacterium]
MNVFPIQSPPEEATQAKCPNCAATVVADQRYCLTCGRPCSHTRPAFLDMLRAESEPRGSVSVIPPQVYAPPADYLAPAGEDGTIGWLRRYSGLFGLLAVLLMCGLIGLLVGHWLAPSKAAGPQIVKIEGTLPAATAASAASTTTAAALPAPRAPTTSKAATEAQEVKEAGSSKTKLKAPAKTNASSISKLEKTTGKQHQKEVEALTAGGKPIETGK